MEKYIIRVNGTEYEVEVEKKTDASEAAYGFKTDADAPERGGRSLGGNPGGTAASAAGFPMTAADAAGTAALRASRLEALNADISEASLTNGEKVTAGTAGKVWKVTAGEGSEVKRGDSIVVLEAMKMEIPIVAPCDGRVGKIMVNEGDSVDMGQVVAVVA